MYEYKILKNFPNKCLPIRNFPDPGQKDLTKRTQPKGPNQMDPRYLDPNQNNCMSTHSVLYFIHQVNNGLHMEQVNILFRVGRDTLKHINYLYYVN